MMLRCPIDNLPCGSTGCSFRGGINEQCHRQNYSLHIEIIETPIAMEPTKEQERCPTCDRVWSDPIGRYCSNSWHLATPDIMRQLSRLQSENERVQQELQAYRDIIKELLPVAESHLCSAEYGYNSEEYCAKLRDIIKRSNKLIDTVTPT